MDGDDIALRNLTYRQFVDLGHAPTVHDIAAVTGATPDDVWSGWQRLHDEHALVVQSHTRELRMANPFSAVPTAYRVSAGNRWWYANCAWDAFGVCAALHVDGRIEASCADCGEPVTVHVRPSSGRVRCVRSTSASMRPFSSATGRPTTPAH